MRRVSRGECEEGEDRVRIEEENLNLRVNTYVGMDMFPRRMVNKTSAYNHF